MERIQLLACGVVLLVVLLDLARHWRRRRAVDRATRDRLDFYATRH